MKRAVLMMTFGSPEEILWRRSSGNFSPNIRCKYVSNPHKLDYKTLCPESVVRRPITKEEVT